MRTERRSAKPKNRKAFRRRGAGRNAAARISGDRGIASLEFVMALPVILLLLVALLTLGSAGTALTGATIKARNDSWRQRDAGIAADTALMMVPSSTTDTLVSRTATQKAVAISPRITLAPADARHTVLAGAWDHHDLPMNSAPHWKLYSRLAAGGAANDLLAALDGIFAIRELLGNIVEAALSAITGLLDQASDWTGQMENQQEEINREAREKNSNDRMESEARLRALEEKKRALEAEQRKVRMDIEAKSRLLDDLKVRIQNEANADLKKKLQMDHDQAVKDLDQLRKQDQLLTEQINQVKDEIERERLRLDAIKKVGQAL